MLLAITLNAENATDLGYLLHKNPGRIHNLDLSFGKSLVYYPEATETRCTVSLQLEIDSVGLVRGKTQDQYVNDRPYVSSSFLSVALAKAFGTAMNGRCKERPDLAPLPLSFEVLVAPLSSPGGENDIFELFEPLDYDITIDSFLLDETFPEWGLSPYFKVKLQNKLPIAVLLRHLYVLLPVLDGPKHYWIDQEEIHKLVSKGEGWLAEHPQRERIVNRYLKHQRHLTKRAGQILDEQHEPDPDSMQESSFGKDVLLERPLRLNEQRLEKVATLLRESGAEKVIDCGCGTGSLIRKLLAHKPFTQIVGLDVSNDALNRARERIEHDKLPPSQRAKLNLFQGSLLYRDQRLRGFDAMSLVEVIEHIDRDRLASLEQVVFGIARSRLVIVTTPNREFNVLYGMFAPGQLRHADHRFEWTRKEFKEWAERVARDYGYNVSFDGVGWEDSNLGHPTQIGIFSR